MGWQYPAPGPIAPFMHWPYTMTIPQFYWDAESQEQRVKYLCMLYDKLMAYVDAVKDNVNVNSDAIAELQEAFAKFQESGFNDYYREQVEKWIGENLKFIYEQTVKQVYFGLTDDGYFCAYIPDSWDDIVFDTGAVYGTAEYGRLILKWIVDGNPNVPAEPDYPYSDIESIMNRLSAIEMNLARNNGTLYTPLGASVSLVKKRESPANPLK